MATTTNQGGSATSGVDVTKPGGWAQAVLAAIGAPNDPNTPQGQRNIDFLEAQAKAEGTSATYNPLATTLTLPGSTDFNAAGVQSYATPGDGITAMARTLLAGYPAIVANLQKADPEAITGTAAGRADLNRWSTGTSSTGYSQYVSNIAKLFFGEHGASDWTSFDLNDAENAAAAAADKVPGVAQLSSLASSVSTFVSNLFNANLWRRVGLALLGVVMLMAGGLMLARQGTGFLPIPA